MIPVKVIGVGRFVEGDFFEGSSVVAVRVIRAAVKVAVFGPDLLKFGAAFGAVEVGGDFGDVGFFFGKLYGGGKVFPEFLEEGFPVDVGFGNFVELVFHPGGKGDVHDLGEVVFEHLADDFSELSGDEGVAFFGGVGAALDFLHDGGVGGGAADSGLF